MNANTKPLITPIILTGGQLKRLLSTSLTDLPKKFLPLNGPFTLFKQTMIRITDDEYYSAPVIFAAETYRFIVLDLHDTGEFIENHIA